MEIIISRLDFQHLSKTELKSLHHVKDNQFVYGNLKLSDGDA